MSEVQEYQPDPALETPLQEAILVREGAQERFKKWGVSDEAVQELQGITASFRYDLVPERVGDLARGELLLLSGNGKEYAFMPHFYDTMGKQAGVCGDLSVQFLGNGRFQAWLEDVNDAVAQAGGKEIQVALSVGTSETHPMSHVWVSLHQDGETDRQNFVDVDPAMQSISAADENGYRYSHVEKNVKEVSYPLGDKFRVGTLTEGRIVGADPFTLGMSSNREYVYNGLFARDVDSGELKFGVGKVGRDGNSTGVHFETSKSEPEISMILEASRRFNPVEVDGNDPGQIQRLTDSITRTHTVKFG